MRVRGRGRGPVGYLRSEQREAEGVDAGEVAGRRAARAAADLTQTTTHATDRATYARRRRRRRGRCCRGLAPAVATWTGSR